MKEVCIEEAVGMVLAHDLTKVVSNKFKGRVFKKGHVICQSDLAELLNIGKKHVYTLDISGEQLHEEEAALRLAKAICGAGTIFKSPAEGKVNIYASSEGLLKVRKEALYEMNTCSDISVATLHTNLSVTKGELIAGARVIPLVVDLQKVITVENIAATVAPVLQVLPYRHCRVGLIITGSEIVSGRIIDSFAPIVIEKLIPFPHHLTKKIIVGDEQENICRAIMEIYEAGVEIIFVTGGMSVDPDDRTPAAIRSTGAEVVTYGTPVLPGSMLMLAYLENVPLLGLPGCVMYSKKTVLDLILPRIFSGEKIIRKDFVEMSVGGLCRNCDSCNFIRCSFGKN